MPVVLFALAMIPVMWTIGGWDESPFVAEEIKDPQRNLPRSILGGLAVVAVLYVAANAAYLAILSTGEIAGTPFRTATVAMERALGGGARKAMAAALMISAFGAANGLALTGGRIAYATGRGHKLFAWFAHTHPATKTPVRGLFLQAALTITAIHVLSHPFQLLLYTGLAYWAFAAITALAVLVMRRRDPDRDRPFKVIGYPVIPVFFALASVAMAVSVIVAEWRNALATGIILAAGVVAYLLAGRPPARNDEPA